METGRTKGEQAEALFREGYNCAQSVAGAFCEELGMEREQAMRLASSFGGGIGRLRETCGAVSAMAMVAGALFGYAGTGENGEKAAHYARVQRLMGSFRARFGTLTCRELLAGLRKDSSPTPEARTPQYYKERPCAGIIHAAADLLEQFIEEERNHSL